MACKKHSKPVGEKCKECEKEAKVSESSSLMGLASGKIEATTDIIAEKLDEIASLCEHWKKNREKGLMPSSIRMAMIMLADEIVIIHGAEQILREAQKRIRG